MYVLSACECCALSLLAVPYDGCYWFLALVRLVLHIASGQHSPTSLVVFMGTRSQAQSKMDGSHLAPGGIGGGAGARHGEDVGGRPNLSRLNSHESQSHQDFFSMNIPSRPASVLGAGMDGNASKRQPRKLVLCFDGTGNKFKGDDSDSNILKIFRMLDRNSSDQCKSETPATVAYANSTSLTPSTRSLLPA